MAEASGVNCPKVENDGGDEALQMLKEKAKKRRGRGFVPECVETRTFGRAAIGGPAPNPVKSVEGWVLFVTNVHKEAQEEDMHEIFSDYGIPKVTINLDRRDGFGKGYAFVQFSTYEAADAARLGLDGFEFLEQKIGVQWCFMNGPPGPTEVREKAR